MHLQTDQTGQISSVDGTLLAWLFGLSLILFISAFLAHKGSVEVTHASGKKTLVWTSRVLLVVAGLFVAFGLAEAAFRLAWPGGVLVRPTVATTSVQAKVEQLPDGQSYWEYHEHMGYDAQGFLGGYKPVDRDRTRLLFLGDSVTFGAGVAVEDNYVSLLEDLLSASCPNIDIYNIAVPGYGTTQERVSLERKGPSVEPDVVILGVVTNDPVHLTFVGSLVCDIRIKESNGRPEFSLLPLPDNINRWLIDNSVMYQVLTLRGISTLDQKYGKYDAYVEASVDEMEQIRQWTVSNGARLILVLFPDLDRPMSDAADSTDYYYGAVREWASRHTDVLVLDPSTALAPHDLASLSNDGCCHFSELGHRVVAEWLQHELSKNAVVPSGCRPTL